MSEIPNYTVDYDDSHLNYEQKIVDFFEQNHPDVSLPQRTIDIIVPALNYLYYTYGEGQTDHTRRVYHNDEHAFEVLDRGTAWLKRFQEQFGVTFKNEDYEIIAIAAAYHDIVIGAKDESTSDESLSAQVAVDVMRESPIQFGAKMRRRVRRAIESTTVEYRDGNVFQTEVLKGKPDFTAVAIALADSSAVLTEDEDKIIEHVSKLAMEHIPANSDDTLVITDSVMKILENEEKFVDQRLQDFQKYIEFLTNDPDKAKNIIDQYFDNRREHILNFTRRIDGNLEEIRQTVNDSLNDSKEATERIATKIYQGILRGLKWLPPTD